MAIFRLTEEQYKRAIAEGVKISADAGGNVSNVASAASEAASVANMTGGKVDTVEVNNVTNSTTNEGRLITKKELKENRLKKLRENSEIISVKDLFNL